MKGITEYITESNGHKISSKTVNSELYNILSNYVADYFLNKNTEITQENLQTAFNDFINKFYNA